MTLETTCVASSQDVSTHTSGANEENITDKLIKQLEYLTGYLDTLNGRLRMINSKLLGEDHEPTCYKEKNSTTCGQLARMDDTIKRATSVAHDLSRGIAKLEEV